MAEHETVKSGVDKAQVTLAEAEAKLRAAATAAERIDAQKLVRAAEEELKKVEQEAKKAEEAAAAQAAAVKKHVVQKGESLSLIAKQYYGDIHKWKDLYEANKTVIGDNPDVIKPGQELVIP